MELGIYTFGERSPDPATGETITPARRLANLIEEIELADRLGLDVFGVGEHHRRDFVVSAPAVVLAAAAMRTRRIRLTSAVTVLSSDDPVRVFEEFATLDLLSEGRAEIMAGRGSFTESFPLFGYALRDYDALFSEKLELLVRLRDEDRVTWSGRFRPPLPGLGVYPRPLQPKLPIWVAVGGTPASAMRAGALGLPMGLAIIGGDPARFVRFARIYREAARSAGHGDAIAFGLNVHGYIADTREAALDEFYPPYRDVMDRLGRERGWPPTSRAHYESEASPAGPLLVGNPEDVAKKILTLREMFGADRLLIQFSLGTMPHERIMRCIELYGAEVAPAVRRALAGAEATGLPRAT